MDPIKWTCKPWTCIALKLKHHLESPVKFAAHLQQFNQWNLRKNDQSVVNGRLGRLCATFGTIPTWPNFESLFSGLASWKSEVWITNMKGTVAYQENVFEKSEQDSLELSCKCVHWRADFFSLLWSSKNQLSSNGNISWLFLNVTNGLCTFGSLKKTIFDWEFEIGLAYWVLLEYLCLIIEFHSHSSQSLLMKKCFAYLPPFDK